MNNGSVTIPMERFEELLDKETRLDVLTDRLIRCECINAEEMLRIIGSSDAIKRADELKAEYDKWKRRCLNENSN